jgi:hypothetical protein
MRFISETTSNRVSERLFTLDHIGYVGAGGPVEFWGVAQDSAIGVPFAGAEPRITAAVFGLAGVKPWPRLREGYCPIPAHGALAAPARARRSGARHPGQPGTLARAEHRGAVTVSDRPAGRPVLPLARASARKRANTRNGTND